MFGNIQSSSYPLKQGTGIGAVELVEKKGYPVKLVALASAGTNGGITEAARSLGISESNIHKWRKQYREGRLVMGHKRAQPTADEAELRRLQAEVKRLETGLAIVKKAAKSPQREVPSEASRNHLSI